jgi:hypothetical protein
VKPSGTRGGFGSIGGTTQRGGLGRIMGKPLGKPTKEEDEEMEESEEIIDYDKDFFQEMYDD